MPQFDGPNLLITLDDPTGGVLNISVEADLYSDWKEWTLGNYFFNTETDVNGTTERITYTNHSLHTGQDVVYTNEGGTENIGLTSGTIYWVRYIDRNTFELYDTEANSENDPSTVGRIDLTASGVGLGETHKIEADNAKFLAAFRTIGGDPLTPGVDAGPYFFLQNDVGWRIISSDADQTINYQGNLVAEDSSLPLIVETPGRTVLHLGLQPVTQRVDELLELSQGAEYAGGVWIDTINGIAGTDYPAGTQAAPVNNLAQAITIANNLGFEFFYLRGSITLTSALTDWRIQGYGSDVENIVTLGGQDVSGTVIKDCSVSGSIAALTKDVDFVSCRVDSITGFRGTMESCGLENNVLLASGQSNIVNCYSAAPGVQVMEFDFQGGNSVNLFVRGMIGVFEITNSSNAASFASVDLLSGRLTITNTWTAGNVSIRGTGTYDNNSLLSINDTGLIDQKDVRLIKQMTSGNATVSVDDLTVTVYDEDNITVLATFSLSADGRIRTRTS